MKIPKGFEISETFNMCTNCGKSLSAIHIPIKDRKAIHKQRNKIRLCRACSKDSKQYDDVITLELKRAGII